MQDGRCDGGPLGQRALPEEGVVDLGQELQLGQGGLYGKHGVIDNEPNC